MHEAKNPPPLLWRRKEWCRLVGGMSPATFYRERNRGHIAVLKIGTATLVKTSPEQYISDREVEQAEVEANGLRRGRPPRKNRVEEHAAAE